MSGRNAPLPPPYPVLLRPLLAAWPVSGRWLMATLAGAYTPRALGCRCCAGVRDRDPLAFEMAQGLGR